LESFPLADLVPLASIPGHPGTSEVEISKEIWPAVRTVVHTVTIALESGASPVAGGFFPVNGPAVAANDQLVLLHFIIIRDGGLYGDSAPSKKRRRRKRRRPRRISSAEARHLSIPTIPPFGCHRRVAPHVVVELLGGISLAPDCYPIG
jgi:hypothetical protein